MIPSYPTYPENTPEAAPAPPAPVTPEPWRMFVCAGMNWEPESIFQWKSGDYRLLRWEDHRWNARSAMGATADGETPHDALVALREAIELRAAVALLESYPLPKREPR